MLRKKRGISPLIASVLLIGFVIAVAAMLFIWWGDFVKQKAIKEGLQNDAQRDCMSYVDIDVKSAEISTDGVELIFVINNKGSKSLTGFRFRIDDSGEVKTITAPGNDIMGGNIDSVSQGIIKINMEKYGLATPTEAEVMPIILESSVDGSLAYTCTNKLVKITI